ncbi:MAG TPA: BMP family ABC transporter substrate-binding protein, partial [Limnochordia bacterium]|nr:BMP family ABC transporter substrate-binding protein [Limnochordia bacterium]
MNRKLFVILSLALVLLVSSAAMAQPIRVALVLSGFLGDQSFNDSAYQGLQRAIEDFGIELRVLESGNPADWEQNLVAMADAGYDLV